MKVSVTSCEVVKVGTGGAGIYRDLLAVEEPLGIRIGFGAVGSREQHELSVTMRTPAHDFELVIGFLFTEGIISAYGQVESIHYCEDVGRQEEKGNVVRVELKPDVTLDFQKLQRNFYTTSSCGVCGKSSLEAIRMCCAPVVKGQRTLPPSTILALPEKLRKEQTVFEYTGGLHGAGLFDLQGNIILIREDVGRHNALDKVIGAALMKNMLPLSDYIMLVSGRASFELIQKAVMAGVPVLAAVGAPSSLAVALAKEFGMTLVGFVRDDRFNIYAGGERIRC